MNHVRIDEGVKRGPRKKVPTVHKRDPETGRALAVLPEDLLPAEVIDRYLSDERTADIAAAYGVKRSRLNQWLLEHAEEPWRKAQVARAVTAMEQAKDDLGTADDPLTLARAREQLRSAQWELERLFSRLYGQKQEITHNVADDLADRLMRARDRLNQPNAAVLPPVSTQTALIEDAQVIDPT